MKSSNRWTIPAGTNIASPGPNGRRESPATNEPVAGHHDVDLVLIVRLLGVGARGVRRSRSTPALCETARRSVRLAGPGRRLKPSKAVPCQRSINR